MSMSFYSSSTSQAKLKKKMEEVRDIHDLPLSRTQKTERKIIEKNRRNHMKNLYSKLFSLLPNRTSQELLSVPDEIDLAMKYIKSLEKRVQKGKEKLLEEEKRQPRILRNESTTKSPRFPHFEIQAIGAGMDVILVSGLDKEAGLFYGILRMLHGQGFDVVNANFSISGNSMIQVVNRKGGNSAEVAKRLRELIYGSTHGEPES